MNKDNSRCAKLKLFLQLWLNVALRAYASFLSDCEMHFPMVRVLMGDDVSFVEMFPEIARVALTTQLPAAGLMHRGTRSPICLFAAYIHATQATTQVLTRMLTCVKTCPNMGVNRGAKRGVKMCPNTGAN